MRHNIIHIPQSGVFYSFSVYTFCIALKCQESIFFPLKRTAVSWTDALLIVNYYEFWHFIFYRKTACGCMFHKLFHHNDHISSTQITLFSENNYSKFSIDVWINWNWQMIGMAMSSLNSTRHIHRFAICPKRLNILYALFRDFFCLSVECSPSEMINIEWTDPYTHRNDPKRVNKMHCIEIYGWDSLKHLLRNIESIDHSCDVYFNRKFKAMTYNCCALRLKFTG